MTKEELIKDNFPNDEFLQSGVLQIVDKCTAELEKAYNETEELLDKQTEETYKLFKENAEMKELIKKLVYEYKRLCLIKKETITKAEQFLKGKL